MMDPAAANKPVTLEESIDSMLNLAIGMAVAMSRKPSTRQLGMDLCKTMHSAGAIMRTQAAYIRHLEGMLAAKESP